MPVQISFPSDADFPPEKKSQQDIILEHMFQVLPANSVTEIRDKLNKRGFEINYNTVARAIKHLRSHCEDYGWTIPHFNRKGSSKNKYYAILLEKDQKFHIDPTNLANLNGGTESMLTRICTESKNHVLMLKAAAQSTYVRKQIREELIDMADECDGVHKRGRRVLRYLKANNG